jgi:hypothetical protein
VRTAEAAHHPKFRIKQVLSVAAIRHTVVHDLLQNDFERSLRVERQILSVTSNYLTELL